MKKRQRDVINAIYSAIKDHDLDYIIGRTEPLDVIDDGISFVSFDIPDDDPLELVGPNFVVPGLLAIERGLNEKCPTGETYIERDKAFFLSVVYRESVRGYIIYLIPERLIREPRKVTHG